VAINAFRLITKRQYMTKLFSTHQANLLAALFFLLNTPITSLAQPQEAQNITIQNCHYINRVEGFSGYGKNLNWQSLAKYHVLSRAEKLGATHIVWEDLYTNSGFSGTATAKAYNCKS